MNCKPRATWIIYWVISALWNCLSFRVFQAIIFVSTQWEIRSRLQQYYQILRIFQDVSIRKIAKYQIFKAFILNNMRVENNRVYLNLPIGFPWQYWQQWAPARHFTGHCPRKSPWNVVSEIQMISQFSWNNQVLHYNYFFLQVQGFYCIVNTFPRLNTTDRLLALRTIRKIMIAVQSLFLVYCAHAIWHTWALKISWFNNWESNL